MRILRISKDTRFRDNDTRWTHLLAIRLSHCLAAVGAAERIQKMFAVCCPAVREAFVSGEKLHCTLVVTCAERDESLARLTETVQNLGLPQFLDKALFSNKLSFFASGKVIFLQTDLQRDSLMRLTKSQNEQLYITVFNLSKYCFNLVWFYPRWVKYLAGRRKEKLLASSLKLWLVEFNLSNNSL